MAPDQAGCGEPSGAGHGRSTQGALRAGRCFSLGMGSPCCTPAPMSAPFTSYLPVYLLLICALSS